MVVVSAQDKGAQDFLDAVWPNGELFIDEEEEFKKALGAQQYSNFWLLKPSVLSKARSYFKSFGMNTADTLDAKTQMLGGVRALLSRPRPPVGHMPTILVSLRVRPLLSSTARSSTRITRPRSLTTGTHERYSPLCSARTSRTYRRRPNRRTSCARDRAHCFCAVLF